MVLFRAKGKVLIGCFVIDSSAGKQEEKFVLPPLRSQVPGTEAKTLITVQGNITYPTELFRPRRIIASGDGLNPGIIMRCLLMLSEPIPTNSTPYITISSHNATPYIITHINNSTPYITTHSHQLCTLHYNLRPQCHF